MFIVKRKYALYKSTKFKNHSKVHQPDRSTIWSTSFIPTISLSHIGTYIQIVLQKWAHMLYLINTANKQKENKCETEKILNLKTLFPQENLVL